MWKCEMKKFFSKTTNRVILTALTVVTILFSFLAVNDIRYTDADGEAAAGIDRLTAGRRLAEDQNRWKGELTPEKISNIVESYAELNQRYAEEIPNTEYGRTVQSYMNILFFADKLYTPEYDHLGIHELAEKDIAHIYDTYTENLQKMAKTYGETSEQEEYLKKQYAKIKMPVIYEGAESWDEMAIYAQMYIAILVVVIGFLAAGIFDEEFRNHAELVYFSAKYGRSKAVRNKIVVGMITATMVYWAGVGILSLISFSMMGVSGFDTLYQISSPYSSYVITQGQRYLLIAVCGYIAALLSAAVTMLVTAKMRTAKVAVCIPFILYYVMIPVGQILSNVTDMIHFTPDKLVYILEIVKAPHFFQIGKIVIAQVPFVMALYSVIAVILLPFIYRSYSRYGFTDPVRRELRRQQVGDRKEGSFVLR